MSLTTSFKTVTIWLFIYFHLVLRSKSASCSSFNTSAECSNDNRCLWDSAVNVCYCATTAHIDVIFFIDESGSMSSTAYVQEKQFVVDMINQGLSQQSHAHVFRFGSYPSQIYAFWERQWPRDAISSNISNAYKAGGGTNMNAALQEVSGTFAFWETQSGYEGFHRLVVFLTDGQASGTFSPCLAVPDVQSVVGTQNIIVVGMGTGWDPLNIECMVTPGYPNGTADYSRILEVDTFTTDAFEGALQAIDSFLCPEIEVTTDPTMEPTVEPTTKPTLLYDSSESDDSPESDDSAKTDDSSESDVSAKSEDSSESGSSSDSNDGLTWQRSSQEGMLSVEWIVIVVTMLMIGVVIGLVFVCGWYCGTKSQSHRIGVSMDQEIASIIIDNHDTLIE